MSQNHDKSIHPMGESNTEQFPVSRVAQGVCLTADTFKGKVHIEWDPQAPVTVLGQLAFFVEFLKQGNLFDSWVDDFPLHLLSPNAPKKRDVLGTLLLSILAGHKRYAHVTTIRADGVNPELLGMRKVVSEDSLRRCFAKIDEAQGIAWLQRHLHYCYGPLLTEPWILDVDTTVKVIYGKQEGAVVGYNPKKPGRPSHTYHAYILSNLRLVLDVEVQPGNQNASCYSAPDLWTLLTRIPRSEWPQLLRGDSAFGTEAIMSGCEQEGLPYLFKLRTTKKVKQLMTRLARTESWQNAGYGLEGQESTLKLQGWAKPRRVILLRKRIRQELVDLNAQKGQTEIQFCEVGKNIEVYEYAVLVTSLACEISSIAQLYRDRADSENAFDELKNQWGWGGYTTQDLKRCRLMARTVGLIYNWWSLFVRLAEPDQRLEAITSRPLLLHAVGKQTSHGGQTFITLTSAHGKSPLVEQLFSRICSFFKELKACAEQLTSKERWYRILSKAMEKYLNGRLLKPPDRLLATT
jgi:hypothetical protein